MNKLMAFAKLLAERSARNKAASSLLLMSDRQLDDIGISRAKLRKGASAYPWYVGPHITTVNEYKRSCSKKDGDFGLKDIVA